MFYTQKEDVLYAISFVWPVAGHLLLHTVQQREQETPTKVTLLGSDSPITHKFLSMEGGKADAVLCVSLPSLSEGGLEEAKHKAWVFKLEGISQK